VLRMRSSNKTKKPPPSSLKQSNAKLSRENKALKRQLQERDAALCEALEHQAATAEVLGIINRSPTDVQPVLDAIVESAARVCGIDDVVLRLREGENMLPRAHFGTIPFGRIEISADEPQFRWVREYGALHVPDARAQTEFRLLSARTFILVPLLHHGELIGVLVARRIEVHPFTPPQIKLLETFADQAVIAIENSGCSKNSRSRWSNKRRQAKYLVSLPARQQMFSRC
jgi:GAF domain-containing protein